MAPRRLANTHMEARTHQQLRRPGSAQPLDGYLRELWRLRHYAKAIGQARTESTNANTTLGKAWLLGEPLLFIAVYGTIFGWILQVDRGVENFIGFLATGQILFRHHSQSMQRAGTSMSQFERQILTMPVPRALFPIASILTSLFTFLPSALVMVVVLLATGEFPTWSWLFLPLLVGGQLLINLGLGFIFARAIAHLPDIANVLTHLFRAMLYGSGVIFPIDAYLGPLENGERYLRLLTVLNPLYDYVSLGRWLLMGMQPYDPGLTLASAAIWSIVTPVVGLAFFKRVELRYGFGQIRNAP